MSTVVLNLYSIAYPTILNSIRVDIATQANPLAVVVSETDSVVGHPARIWTFPGLPRTNYQVRMNEIDALGNPINNLAFFDVVPNSVGMLVRADEQLKVGVTPGLIAGNNAIRFDGGEVGVATGIFRPEYKSRKNNRSWNYDTRRRLQLG